MKNLNKEKIAERTLYISAVILTPSIPLYFLHRQNAAQGLDFNHFLIFGTILALVSLIVYFFISKFYLRRRRTMITLAAFWLFFWTYQPLWYIFYRVFPIVSRRQELFQSLFAAGLLIIVILLAFTLRRIPVNKIFANAFAVMLCVLFLFNFVPAAILVATGEIKRLENERTGNLPYEIKTEFILDSTLPKPNIYWLHMDGMMGFGGVEYFFGDPQTELKKQLVELGFVINEDARLIAGSTGPAILALLSPMLYDSFYGDELTAVSHLTRDKREPIAHQSVIKQGFVSYDAFKQLELLTGLSDAGYLIIIGQSHIAEQSDKIDVFLNGITVNDDVDIKRPDSRIVNFFDLMLSTNLLYLFEPYIYKYFYGEDIKTQLYGTQQVPEYPNLENRYITGQSDSDPHLAYKLRAMKHASTLPGPFFFYSTNERAHVSFVENKIGEITYDRNIGTAFIRDENGNIYRERLDDPNDPALYLPAHKYTVKELTAQINTIIENDPDAVIVLQADHGIHGIGPGRGFNSGFLYERGYSTEEQLYINFSVISAVRIPPQYGSLTEPLDPLDISRWLVNNFVGEGNYEYLCYAEKD